VSLLEHIAHALPLGVFLGVLVRVWTANAAALADMDDAQRRDGDEDVRRW
jgi:hypothetical protein